MRLPLLMAILAASVVSGTARADSFSYAFTGVYGDTFALTSPILITTNQNVTPTTCSAGTYGFTGSCSVFFDLSDKLIELQFSGGGVDHGNLGAAFFTVGTHTVNGNTLTIAQLASAVTPEPSSLVLLGTGVLGLFGVVHRRPL